MKRNGSSRAAMWRRVPSPTPRSSSTTVRAIAREGTAAIQRLFPLRSRSVGLPAVFSQISAGTLSATQVLPVYTPAPPLSELLAIYPISPVRLLFHNRDLHDRRAVRQA